MPRKFNLDGGTAPVPHAPLPYAPPPQPSSFAPSIIDAAFTSITPAVIPSTSTALALTGTPGKALELTEIISAGKIEASRITDTADKINGIAKMSDMDEIGELFSKTMLAAKGYDPDNLMKGGVFSFLRGKATQMTIKFDSVDGSVKKLVGEVDKRIDLYIKRLGDIKAMRTENEQNRAALEVKVAELVARADWMDANIPEVDPNDSNSASRRQEWITVAMAARTRADNLDRAKVNAEQQHALLGMTANNSALLAMKFGIIKETTVPAMKINFAIATLNNEQTKGVEFTDMLDRDTNTAIQKNAQKIGQNVTAVNTSLARSSISIETLQIQHDAITKALDEVERIRAETKQRLITEAPMLKQLSNDLTKRLASK